MDNQDQYTVEELDRENKELKAVLMKIKGSILSLSCDKENNSGCEPSLSVYQRSIDEVIALGLSMPCQSLADIKADAIMELLQEEFYNAPIDGIATSIIDADGAIQYADKLRGES